MLTTETFLGDWKSEKAVAAEIREQLGYCSTSTLARWRRLNTIPEGYEWRYFGRVPMWRKLPEMKSSG
jgi:hypothetical protein